MNNGFIYKDKYEGWYSVSDEAFYSTSQVHEIQNPGSEEKSMVGFLLISKIIKPMKFNQFVLGGN